MNSTTRLSKLLSSIPRDSENNVEYGANFGLVTDFMHYQCAGLRGRHRHHRTVRRVGSKERPVSG